MSDVQEAEEVVVPDTPEGLLGFRVWRVDPSTSTLYSVVIGDGPANRHPRMRILLGNAEGDGSWPHDQPMVGTCARNPFKPKGMEKHDPPHPQCMCGVYAAYELQVIALYIPEAPVMGLVESGGTTIEGDQGWRAEEAKVMCLFAVSEDFTVRRKILERVAERYGVPIVVPHSVKPDDYRMGVRSGFKEGWQLDFTEGKS